MTEASEAAAVYRALIDEEIDRVRAVAADMAALRLPRLPTDDGAAIVRLRAAAIDAHERHTGQDRQAALLAVQELLGHIRRLCREAWFRTDPGACEAAIVETIDYALFHAEVASRPAHELWAERTRLLHAAVGWSGLPDSSGFAVTPGTFWRAARTSKQRRQLDEAWRAAWDRWLQERDTS